MFTIGKGDVEEPDCCQVQDNPEADRNDPDEAEAAAVALPGSFRPFHRYLDFCNSPDLPICYSREI